MDEAPTIIKWIAAWITRWAVAHERGILDEGRTLTERETDWARALGILKAGQIRILKVPKVPVPFISTWFPNRWIQHYALAASDIAGMTLGYGIYVKEGEEAPLLIAHELVHVQQYERLGGFEGFFAAYLLDCFHHGYRKSVLEAEAHHKSLVLMNPEHHQMMGLTEPLAFATSTQQAHG